MIESLLSDKQIDKPRVNEVLTDVYRQEIDYADLYFEHSLLESWRLQDGIIQAGSYHINHGVGIRAIAGDRIGFSYSDVLDLAVISSSAKFAYQGAVDKQSKQKQKIVPLQKGIEKKYYTTDNPLDSLADTEKIAILKEVDSLARQNPLVTQVNASLSGVYSEVLIAASDGTYCQDYRPMTRLNVSIVVQEKGRVEYASSGGGGRFTYEHFLEQQLTKTYTKEALRQAMVALKSKPAPAGVMPVILGSGWPGVLLHEAIGHGLEGDFNRKKTSVYSNKMGKQIANSLCTIVDNGTLKNRRGSLNIDDEGTPTQETVLVENGILKHYMLDKHNARLMNEQSTGNGRRESYAHLPLPRMTNTYMLAGQHTLEDMIASVDKGIYALNFDGGQVDVISGKFVFSANEAYLVKNGKVQYPIKGVSLIGQGDEVLKQISMLGDDLALDSGVGVCGKEGQNIPVGVGQPSLKVDQLTVGGIEV